MSNLLELEKATRERKGSVVVSEHGPVRIHTYVSPANGWLVNTQIVEGPTKLVIFDGQLLNAYAEEVAAYAAALGKPVDRIIVSHGHPDHWAGLDVLTRRFPGTPVYALAGVASFVQAHGENILGRLRGTLGDKVASRAAAPTQVLATGRLTIDTVEFDFRPFQDAESDLQLVALMPKQRVMLAFDLVFAANDHAFTVVPHFDHWIDVLQSLKAIEGYDRILIGHDRPIDFSAIDATIAYLRKAAQLYAVSADGKAYAEGLKMAFPDRQQPGWVDFSATLLYGALKR
jgi:glyoxylase-like metal-dependent hydrolase (beta-lactamase superfamily II)